MANEDATAAFRTWWERHAADYAGIPQGMLLLLWCAAWRRAQAAMLGELARREFGQRRPT